MIPWQEMYVKNRLNNDVNVIKDNDKRNDGKNYPS